MSGILKIRDKDGNFIDFPAIKGKSAYEYAVEGGYQGTEEEFIAFLNGTLAQPLPVALDDGEEEQEPSTELRNKADGVETVLTLLNEGAVDKADVLKLLFNDGSFCAIYGEHNKPKAEDVGALPIEGGTLTGKTVYLDNGNARVTSGQDYVQMDVYDTPKDDNNRRKLVVNGNATDLSSAVVLTSVLNGEKQNYTMFGKHNKPMGSYIGDGKVNERKIQTGGIGMILLISSKRGFIFVHPYGAFCKGSTTAYTYDQDELSFSDGVLTLKTNVLGANETDTVYNWQVL